VVATLVTVAVTVLAVVSVTTGGIVVAVVVLPSELLDVTVLAPHAERQTAKTAASSWDAGGRGITDTRAR
jgi:hypothetical protein